MSETVLKKEERVAIELRSLYKKYGYLPYKMSKFEAYDLYARNKDFLRGDGVITFNDTDGKLLALKPDVTLSIIKNLGDSENLQKVSYSESVYRVSDGTKQFGELTQVGVECIGDIGVYDLYESVRLAAESLALISENFVLDISHLGILSGIFEEIGEGKTFEREAVKLLSEKNLHEMSALVEKYNVPKKSAEKLVAIVSTYGDMQTVVNTLEPLCDTPTLQAAFAELSALYALLKETSFADKIRLDFSVVNNMKYYNGLVFKGFVSGVPEGVLSGGRYDSLVARMGKKSGAIGFAVYLDLLEDFFAQKEVFDVDTLVLYDEKTPMEQIVQAVEQETKAGRSVRAQKSVGTLRYKNRVELLGEKKC